MNKVEVMIINESLIDGLYCEGNNVFIWGEDFHCDDGYILAHVDLLKANELVALGRVRKTDKPIIDCEKEQ